MVLTSVGLAWLLAASALRMQSAIAFDSPSTLESVSYAMDAEAAGDKRTGTFTAKASVLLEHLGEQTCQASPVFALARGYCFEAKDSIGQALCVDKHLRYLSVFPPSEGSKSAEIERPGIRPP
ncbi:MAG: hypothetical protein ACP5HU_12890 [Phycisphaerae bacterium]